MRRRAFTLIELLVIIGIIAVLIAILVPTLGAARNKAYKTQSQALMDNLQSDIAQYFAIFHAYPGPLGLQKTLTQTVYVPTSTTGYKISGAQNLLLGLTYTVLPGKRTPLELPDGAAQHTAGAVDLSAPHGVVDYSTTNPDGSNPQLPPFFNPTPKQISASPVPASGINGGPVTGTTNSLAFPVILDAYPDAEPILYYRRTPGVSSPIAGDYVPVNQAPTYAYYLYENLEYTGNFHLKPNPKDPNSDFDQTKGGLAGGSPANIISSRNYLANLACGLPGSPNPPPNGSAPHGGYIMIDAGTDRIFGTADDIVIVGGD